MLLTGYDVANRLKDDLATGNCLECKANLFFRGTRRVDDVASRFIASNQTTINLAVALLLGAIVGLERGWYAREQKFGERIGGIRAFSLVALLGRISALLGSEIADSAFRLL